MRLLECVDAYRESFDLALRIEDRVGAAAVAHNLGRAYQSLTELRNLDEAERWSRKGLELTSDGDRLLRAGGLRELGTVARQRFREARTAKKPEPELLRYLNDALRWYREALDMTPPDAVVELGVIHNLFGNLYGDAGDMDQALKHWRKAIHLDERQGNSYGAATTRRNVAISLARAGRFADARQYAEAALCGFQAYGAGAVDEVQNTLDLISRIAKAATA
jgi:tetratricopeptide (TPR) repeat protein